MRIDDETLMAYADGELLDAQATDVARAIAKDASIAARYALFTKSKTAVQQAFQDLAPVSADLEARVRAIAAKSATNQNAKPAANNASTPANNVVSLASRRRMVPLWQLPLAAALALAVGVGASRFGTEPQGL
jgi:anti-sigma factor RsiW